MSSPLTQFSLDSLLDIIPVFVAFSQFSAWNSQFNSLSTDFSTFLTPGTPFQRVSTPHFRRKGQCPHHTCSQAFCRLEVRAAGTGRQVDHQGFLRQPFQHSFIQHQRRDGVEDHRGCLCRSRELFHRHGSESLHLCQRPGLAPSGADGHIHPQATQPWRKRHADPAVADHQRCRAVQRPGGLFHGDLDGALRRRHGIRQAEFLPAEIVRRRQSPGFQPRRMPPHAPPSTSAPGLPCAASVSSGSAAFPNGAGTVVPSGLAGTGSTRTSYAGTSSSVSALCSPDCAGSPSVHTSAPVFCRSRRAAYCCRRSPPATRITLSDVIVFPSAPHFCGFPQ